MTSGWPSFCNSRVARRSRECEPDANSDQDEGRRDEHDRSTDAAPSDAPVGPIFHYGKHRLDALASQRMEIDHRAARRRQAAGGGSSFLMPLATTSVRLRAPAPLR